MAKKSVIEQAKSMADKINPRYGLRAGAITELCKSSADCPSMVINGFRYGYMQEMKAAKAEQKKKEATRL